MKHTGGMRQKMYEIFRKQSVQDRKTMRSRRDLSVCILGGNQGLRDATVSRVMGQLMLIWAAELLSLGLIDNWNRILGN